MSKSNDEGQTSEGHTSEGQASETQALKAAYGWLATLAGPALRVWLWQRQRSGKEHPERLAERFGRASVARPSGRLVWFHAASVGEAMSVLPVIECLHAAHPGWTLLVTTGTLTSAALMAERLPNAVIHQFIPLDLPAWTERFLTHWRPSAAIFVESEVWPSVLHGLYQRRTPVIVLNGHLSARSFGRWQRWNGLAKGLFSGLSLVLAQSDVDADRFHRLGVARVESLGNLKLLSSPLSVDEAALATLKQAIGPRPVWLAASTHAGEEALMARVQQHLLRRFPTLLCIIVPRHAVRGRAIIAALTGLRTAQRSLGQPPTAMTELYVADTMGELGLFYRLSPLVVMGKSFVGHGGQNPLEPARLGCALVVGPQMENFQAVTDGLLAVGGAVQVADEAALYTALATHLSDPAQTRQRGAAGQAWAMAEAEAAGQVMPRLLQELAGLDDATP